MTHVCSCPPDKVDDEKARLERSGFEVLTVRTDQTKDVMHITFRSRQETR